MKHIILITGGNGFLGKKLTEKAQALPEAREVFTPSSKEFDLTDEKQVEAMYAKYRPTHVIHAAAAVGGIGKNAEHPGTLYYRNTMMNTLVMEYARRSGVERYVAIGSGCVYPAHGAIPLTEEALWDGYPEKFTAPYGISKKIQITQSKSYFDEFGFNSVVCLPGNLYGPADHFHLTQGHVIPSLVRKFVEAVQEGRSEVVCWGDGTPTRDFIYVDDAAQAIITVMQKAEPTSVYNIASGVETTIKELVETIAKLSGFEGNIHWDTSKPNGQQRRCYSIAKLKMLGFEPEVGLQQGLTETVEWFKQNLHNFSE